MTLMFSSTFTAPSSRLLLRALSGPHTTVLTVLCVPTAAQQKIFFFLVYNSLKLSESEIVHTHYNYWQIFFEYVKHCHLHENTQLLSVSFSLTHSRAAANCFVIYPKILPKYDEV